MKSNCILTFIWTVSVETGRVEREVIGILNILHNEGALKNNISSLVLAPN
jgi:hypothetical protein